MITLFPSHAEVRCLKCDLDLSESEPFAQLKMLQVGAHAKRCPRCKLVTSYDLGAAPVTPREAGKAEWELEEPDWPQAFEDEQARWPKLPKYLQEEQAFEAVLKRWRIWHWTPTADNKKMPAGATEAIIALANLGVMAPRSTLNELPRTDDSGFQADEHMWLSISQEQWRITAIEDRILHLGKMSFDDTVETMQLDLTKVKWNRYTEAAVMVLQAMGGKHD